MQTKFFVFFCFVILLFIAATPVKHLQSPSLTGKWYFTGSADDENNNGKADKAEIAKGIASYKKSIGNFDMSKTVVSFDFIDGYNCNLLRGSTIRFKYSYTVNGNAITIKDKENESMTPRVLTLDDANGYLLTVSPLYRKELGDILSWEVFYKK
jgi:hypothetical protein